MESFFLFLGSEVGGIPIFLNDYYKIPFPNNQLEWYDYDGTYTGPKLKIITSPI